MKLFTSMKTNNTTLRFTLILATGLLITSFCTGVFANIHLLEAMFNPEFVDKTTQLIHLTERKCTISGMIINSNGSAIYPARVALVTDKEVVLLATTNNRDGWYRLEQVQPGSYELIASAPMYMPATITLNLSRGGTYIVDFILASNKSDSHAIIIHDKVVTAVDDSGEVKRDSTTAEPSELLFQIIQVLLPFSALASACFLLKHKFLPAMISATISITAIWLFIIPLCSFIALLLIIYAKLKSTTIEGTAGSTSPE